MLVLTVVPHREKFLQRLHEFTQVIHPPHESGAIGLIPLYLPGFLPFVPLPPDSVGARFAV